MKIDQNIKVAVDAVVFGYSNNQLFVLLIKQKYGVLKGKWALVGGFVKNEESLTQAVHRELREETGIQVNYLEQLFTFGDDLQRDPRGRVVTVAYFALINSTRLIPEPGTDALEAQWFPIQELPELAFDHKAIIKAGEKRLKAKLSYQPIGFELLPKEFLFSDLENLYCTILEKNIDRRNFRKKILSFGFVEETEKFGPIQKGRPARLYKFVKSKYKILEKEGFVFDINFA